MMSNHNIWVTAGKNGQWEITEEGSNRVLGTASTQEEAINQAREHAKANRSEMIVKGEDGKIRQRNSYGTDPRSSEG